MTAAPSWVVELMEVTASDAGLTTRAVLGELHYEVEDPLAVRLRLRRGPGDSDSWTFARELLVDGLSSPAGDGDVHVWPVPDSDTVAIECRTGDGGIIVEAAADRVRAFVDKTLRLVAVGEESRHLQVDRVIAAILASVPR